MSALGWIGVGNMGGPMAARLCRSGYDMLVCGSGKRDLSSYAAETGARLATSTREIAQKTDVFFTMIPNGEILLDIISQIEDLDLTGKVLVDMSTIDPESSAAAAARIEVARGQFLRAPVTGSTHFAAEGTLGIMVSGAREAYEQCLPYLRILGSRQTYLGEGEKSREIKILINLLLAQELQALSETLVIGGKLELPWETMLDLIVDSAAAAPIFRYKADTLKDRDFTPTSSGYNMHKDMKMAMALAARTGAKVPAAEVTMQRYDKLMELGMARKDNTAILLVNEWYNSDDPDAVTV